MYTQLLFLTLNVHLVFKFSFFKKKNLVLKAHKGLVWALCSAHVYPLLACVDVFF